MSQASRFYLKKQGLLLRARRLAIDLSTALGALAEHELSAPASEELYMVPETNAVNELEEFLAGELDALLPLIPEALKVEKAESMHGDCDNRGGACCKCRNS